MSRATRFSAFPRPRGHPAQGCQPHSAAIAARSGHREHPVNPVNSRTEWPSPGRGLTLRGSPAILPAMATRLASSPLRGPEISPSRAAVLSYARLPANWDSYGAAPVSPAAIRAAMAFLAEVDRHLPRGSFEPYTTAPIPDGGIQLEWRGPLGCVEIEVGPGGELSFLELGPGGNPIRETNPATAVKAFSAIAAVR